MKIVIAITIETNTIHWKAVPSNSMGWLSGNVYWILGVTKHASYFFPCGKITCKYYAH